VSQATDFLTEWIQKAEQRLPSITVTLAQRWPVTGTPPDFRPGLTGYGWGINGRLVEGIRDPGHDHDLPPGGLHPGGVLTPGGIPGVVPLGLRFPEVYLWFSDRGQDVGSPQDFGQQFLATAEDRAWIELTFAGDAVQLQIHYYHAVAWNYDVIATTTQVDQPSQQLLFSDLPPAGADPVQAFMIVSLADTGEFGWL
jgi:hypothetical protein